jgi:arylsulfatase A-like enzyme
MQTPGRLGADGVATLRALYDAETAEFDAEFGRFRAELAARGLMDDTLFVFVADHGEEFREHGNLQHGHTLHAEVMDVPLLVRLPAGRGGGRRVAALARHVDLMPTILALAGVDDAPDLPGRVLPLADEGAGGHEPEAIVETWFGDPALGGLVLPPWKVVLPRLVLAARPAVYQLAQDPAERHDLTRERPVLLGYARQRLAENGETARALPLPADAAGSEPHPEALDRLRALGYVVD